MIKRFFELQERVLSYHPKANTELLKKAYSVAADAHIGQKRATNEPYIIHPLKVAGTLADMKLDDISIAAGLLHDVVEDTDYTREDITKLFGKEISDIVWGVTKISKISAIDAEDAKAETLKKMILAMTHDVRVILIKLADRYHNIRTLDALPEEKQKRVARETLDLYAPIAYRLGIRV
jgi:GTP pyrophosphokinase